MRSKENQSEILIIGNTHLYFKPDADHIRLLQGYYAIIYVHEVARKIREEVYISFGKNYLRLYVQRKKYNLETLL